MGILSFFGRMFGSDKATEKVIDNISSGLDKLYYSKEEQAEDRAKAVTESRHFLLEWMKNTQGQNLSRRFIAVLVTTIWSFLFLFGWAVSVIACFCSADVAAMLMKSAEMTYNQAQAANGAVMLILGYYFAAPHLSTIVDSAMSKFSNSKVNK